MRRARAVERIFNWRRARKALPSQSNFHRSITTEEGGNEQRGGHHRYGGEERRSGATDREAKMERAGTTEIAAARLLVLHRTL
eukprot:IDg9875t1